MLKAMAIGTTRSPTTTEPILAEVKSLFIPAASNRLALHLRRTHFEQWSAGYRKTYSSAPPVTSALQVHGSTFRAWRLSQHKRLRNSRDGSATKSVLGRGGRSEPGARSTTSPPIGVAAGNHGRARHVCELSERIGTAMRGCGVAATAVLWGLLAPSPPAGAKERRLWVDPPPLTAPLDTPATIPTEPGPQLQGAVGQDGDVTGSVGVSPEPFAVETRAPLYSGAPSHASCTTKTYTVLSGATVRVHACK